MRKKDDQLSCQIGGCATPSPASSLAVTAAAVTDCLGHETLRDAVAPTTSPGRLTCRSHPPSNIFIPLEFWLSYPTNTHADPDLCVIPSCSKDTYLPNVCINMQPTFLELSNMCNSKIYIEGQTMFTSILVAPID